MSGTTCVRFQEDIVGLLEGTATEALKEHVAGCDFCRDARHDLETVARLVGSAGDDLAFTPALAAKLETVATEAALIARRAPDDAVVERISETRVRDSNVPSALASPRGPPQAAVASAPLLPPPSPVAERPRPSRNKRLAWLAVAACASIAASAGIGIKLADRQRSPELAATRAWHGKVAAIARNGKDQTGGLYVTTPSGKAELGEGAEIKAGMHVWTDGRTRARLELDDGSFVVLDRATSLSMESAPRTVTVQDGAILADVAHLESTKGAWVETPAGRVHVLGTKLAVTAAADRMNVEVLRGDVEVMGKSGPSSHVAAGQEGVVTKDGRIDVAPANDLAQRAAFGEQLVNTHNEDTEAAASGLGELRARRPGRTDEKDHAVHLARHSVKIRIAGDVARTEIDEEFSNDTDDELEGIYRFPLPHGAQIERLALSVDGQLVDGEFVDKAKAAAIWRGAIHNAAPQQPRPKEELVWVPGPWKDPALLEWARGGRFELKIFPIPKKGSRRVVIAYTETVAPVSGIRRYVYPLPQGSSSQLTIDQFSVDAQVLGHDAKAGVRARGYELEKKTEGSAEHLRTNLTAFTPSGDLAIEYGLDDAATDATVFTFGAPAPAAADPVGSDAFVAVALRPKLPKWADTKPRDQVIMLDAGRAMFGERFARAKRLAVQMAQEMDRRDRVTVLACDVACRAMPGGFVAPGAPTAHDVDAFLDGVTPDGASDLVGAVRMASQAAGHDDQTRDLRIVVLSDGVATAGYRSNGRVATEIGESMHNARAEVVTVPIGADADVVLLSEIARGGGGVVVPYQPGQRLESTALEVLNATYGTTLRDVQVILPAGLHDVAPATLAPLRAGSETIVTARLTGDAVKGDIILKGNVGGEPFEAKYPIDARVTTDAGNAFVPRLFAAARIADRERDATDAQKTELVALSRRFAVPSRFTSLLVLESEAMFKAFGIDRSDHATAWTGESAADGSLVATLAPATKAQGHGAGLGFGDGRAGGALGGATARSHASVESADPFGADDLSPSSAAPADEAKKDVSSGNLGLSGKGEGGGGSGAGGLSAIGGSPRPSVVAPAPAATSTPQQQAERAAPAKRKAPAADALSDSVGFDSGDAWSSRRPGRFMRRIFVRRASITSDSTSAVPADKVALARSAVAAAPDERGKHKELAKLLALSGQLDELGESLKKWSDRDPLDADVIVGRSDLAARCGDRETSLRILGGSLAATGLGRDEAFTLATTVARSYERLGRSEACAFRVTAAELRSTDADAMARAVACERAAGRVHAADRWLDTMKEPMRTAVATAADKVDPAKAETASGDVVVSATWDGGADLDVVLVDPSGRRAGVASRMKGARVEGASSRDHESLGLASNETGAFIVEMARASVSSDAGRDAPVSGKLTIRAFGQSQTVPFTLTGARAQVARVDTRWEAQLVPIEGDQVDAPRAFDRAAASGALASVPVGRCGASGQVGTGHATVTFASSGRVSEVVVDDQVFSGTPAGRCVIAAYFRASVPAFAGGPVKVGKSFTIGPF